MRVGEVLLDLLFPPKCPYCQRVLAESRAPVCPKCQDTLPWLAGCEAERKVDFLDNCFSPLAYRGAVPDAVGRYKFQGVRAYHVPFGQVMAQSLEDHLPQGADLITWVPLGRRRLRKRGYDQARLLAEEVGRRSGIPPTATLVKIKDTAQQSLLEEESARRANVLGAYALLPEVCLEGKRVVLTDDIVTSGASLSECAAQLRLAGAAEVFGLTLAQARSGKK